MMIRPVLQEGEAVVAQPPGRQEDGLSTAGRQKVVYGALLAITLASTGLLIWILQSNPKPDTLKYEAGKTCMQVLGVVLVGFVVSHATFTLQHNREQRERMVEEARDARRRKDELIHSTLNEILAPYQTLKRARRILRARVWAQEAGQQVNADVYDQQMAMINDVQLQFEQLKRDPPLSEDARVDKESLRRYFGTIEKSLGELVAEYERRRAALLQEGASVSDMPRLDKFLEPGPFRVGIAVPIESILSDLREALLKPPELPAPAATGWHWPVWGARSAP
jgi:hypothetical protein